MQATVTDRVLGFLFACALFACQCVSLLWLSDWPSLRRVVFSGTPLEWLHNPVLWLWLALNALAGLAFPHLWRRGTLPFALTRLLLVGAGALLVAGWLRGWFHHLRAPSPWYAQNIPMLRYFVLEGLLHPLTTLAIVATFALSWSLLAALLWTRHCTFRWSGLWPGGAVLLAVVGGLLWHPLPGGDTFWLVAFAGGSLVALTVALAGHPTPSPPTVSQVPGPGWRDLDPPRRPAVTPLAVAVSACTATGLALWSRSLWSLLRDRSTSTLLDPPVALHRLATLPVTPPDLVPPGSWLPVLLALGGVGLLSALLCLAHRKQLCQLSRRLQRVTLWLALTGALVAGATLLYLTRSRELIVQNAPDALHDIAHHFRSVRRLPLPPSLLSSLVGASQTVAASRFADTLRFPLPLLHLGAQRSLLLLSPRRILVGRGWRIRTFLLDGKGRWPLLKPDLRAKEPLQQRQLVRHLTTLHREDQSHSPDAPLLLVLHPKTTLATLLRTLQAADRAGFRRALWLLGTPHRWQIGAAQLPFFRQVRALPLQWRRPSPRRTASAPTLRLVWTDRQVHWTVQGATTATSTSGTFSRTAITTTSQRTSPALRLWRGKPLSRVELRGPANLPAWEWRATLRWLHHRRVLAPTPQVTLVRKKLSR